MPHSRTRSSHLPTLVASLLAWSALAAGPVAARGGDATGDLGAGGHVHGDISTIAAETDTITVDLTAGGALTVALTAGFVAHLVVTDPDGQPFDLGPGGADASHMRAKDVAVVRSGRYTFSVSSADGAQGLYGLSVTQRWPRIVTTSGTGVGEIAVGVPAGGKLAAVVRSAGATPQIVQLADPSGAALLAAAVTGPGHTAKLPPTTAATGGVYRLTVGTVGGASTWTARITRVVPHAPATQLALRNGLDTVSFYGDGVSNVFARRCTPCHGWAGNYGTVKAYLRILLPRITGGSMPPTGRLPGSEIALIRAWASTGAAR